MNKLLKYILLIAGILLLLAVFLLIAFGGLLDLANIFTKIALYIGNGSVVRGFILIPFFIFGIVQIIRSFLMIGNKAQEEAQEGLFRFFSKKSDRGIDFGGVYIILTFVCYLLVFFIIAKPIS